MMKIVYRTTIMTYILVKISSVQEYELTRTPMFPSADVGSDTAMVIPCNGGGDFPNKPKNQPNQEADFNLRS